MYSDNLEILLERQTAFALCTLGEFVFAFDSHGIRAILLEPPADTYCIDLADTFELPRPIGTRRTIQLHQEPHGVFNVTVGHMVRVTTIPLANVFRIPNFIADFGQMRRCMALINWDHQFYYLVDQTALALLAKQESP